MSHVPHDVVREERPDGSILLRSRVALGPVAANTGEWIHRWAQAAPERVFLAERSGAGWRELRYRELLQQVRGVGQSLLARGMNAETPIVIISANSVDHAVLTLAAQYVGVPTVALAEQYALVPEAHPRLIQAIEAVRPAMVYASDATSYGAALALDCMAGIEKVISAPDGGTIGATAWSRLVTGSGATALDAAHAAVAPETVAKIIFTSGSTGSPKGVVTTQRMLCVNQAQMLACNPVLGARPPRLVDWLPWNHVFGGSHNLNLVLANGGSLYIDDGKPTRAGFAASVRNIREQGGSVAFNVPIGFAQLVAAMQQDTELKRAYLGDCDLIFYAAASVPQDVWDALARCAREVRGAVPLMFSGWGMSETAPATLQTHQPVERPGNIGVPLPMVTAKLVPAEEGRYELRVAGPNVLTEYFHAPGQTRDAFDAEGFLVTGDAVRFIDPEDPNAGLGFDGRISEDFKLATGTWVRATNLRLDALRHLRDIASDVVITGHDRNEVGVLIFPHPGVLVDDPGEDDGALISAELVAAVQAGLEQAAVAGTTSSTRIARALVLAAVPSMSDGELTPKGSINARKVLALRNRLVDRLYRDDDPAVIRVRAGS